MPGEQELLLQAQGPLGRVTSRVARRYARAMRAIVPLLALLLVAAAPPQATFTNPVLDADFPDPAVLKAPDGYYYAYATQTEREGRKVNIQVARSRDLVR